MSETLVTILVFLVGTCIGSFLNVCIHRIPRRESIVFEGSMCPACKKRIAFYDNIPILSYILLGGRCRNCRAPISPRYPVVEALTGGVFLLLFFKFGLTVEFVFYSLFSSALIVVTFIDLSFKIIPDVITFPGIIAGAAAQMVLSDSLLAGAVEAVLGILLGGGVLLAIGWLYYVLAGREGMGGGDIKLLAMVGAWAGWKGVVVTLFGATLVGTVVGLGVIALSGRDSKYALPFGPFLAAGALFYILWGEQFIGWYLHTTGLL